MHGCQVIKHPVFGTHIQLCWYSHIVLLVFPRLKYGSLWYILNNIFKHVHEHAHIFVSVHDEEMQIIL